MDFDDLEERWQKIQEFENRYLEMYYVQIVYRVKNAE
jgi:hypothetical protein